MAFVQSVGVPRLVMAMMLLGKSFAAESPQISLGRTSGELELSWPGVRVEPDGTPNRPFFELQSSSDLRHWNPMGERLRAATVNPQALLNVSVPPGESRGFFRLLTLDPPRATKLGIGGADVLGYADAFQAHLDRIGQITSDRFAELFPNEARYLPSLSWDPTTAKYWDLFNANPAALNSDKEWGQPGYRDFDARLNPSELALFRQNGFVVTERLGGDSFAEVFYNLWHADLPVFISCDALLQAWHRTYDAMLEEVEETFLFASVESMLDGMAAHVFSVSAQVGEGVLRESLLDADYFIAVARSLLAGAGESRMVPGEDKVEEIPPAPSAFGQDDRVAATLADIRAEKLKEVPDLMGFCRMVDFSQFGVRGHYTHTIRLGRYFKCVMWLGRMDIPVAGGPWKRCAGKSDRMASPRELGQIIVLWHLLVAAGHSGTWSDIERTLQTFVGSTDSLTFGALGGLLAGANLRTLADVRDPAALERLQADIESGELGIQNIRSDWFEQPMGRGARNGLPQTFAFLGQKFIPDSWALSQTVFSSILWAENGKTNTIQRRVPGALDVAFATLGNNQIVPELVSQMRGDFDDPDRPHARQFRDGLPYQHNLAAVRAVMDSHPPEAWQANIYMDWLGTLRTLSAPTTDPRYPEAMRTRAWAMKTLNTQLASWTHLRHDTILYAKQSYSVWNACLYPTGFVEPRLEFWRRLSAMASRAADQIARLRYTGEYRVQTNWPAILNTEGELVREAGVAVQSVSLSGVQQRQISHLHEFAKIADRLGRLTEKELAAECLAPDDESFIDGLMEERIAPTCGLPARHNGWFPRLFYRAIHWFENERTFHEEYGAGAFDALVADVHTDVPNVIPPDPGSVLHQAVGRVHMLMLAVDNGANRFMCAGPVASHYEFEVIGAPRRLTDRDWKGMEGLSGTSGILRGTYPEDVPRSRIEGLSPPGWTRSYLAR